MDRRIAGLVIIWIVSTAPTMANAEVGDSPTAVDGGLEMDARSYADSFRVTVDQARQRLVAQKALSDIKSAARVALGSRFAGAWTEHEPVYRLVVRVTGTDPSPELEAVLRDAPVPTAVVTNSAQSLDELVAAARRLDEYLAEGLPEVSVELDVKGNSLHLTTPKTVSNVQREAIERVAAVPVRLTVSQDAAFALLHTYGGKRVTGNDGASPCTTGFSIRNINTGVRGVTTAGHCANTNVVYKESDTTSYSLTLRGERFDDDQDAQWMVNSVHTVYPKFWDGSQHRTVTSVAGDVESWVGDYVCHYGVSTGYSCGTIQSVHFDPGNICGPTGSNDCFSSWVKVTGSPLKCDVGDSGGPWFYWGIAYGTQQAGQLPFPDCPAATFMQHNYLTLMTLAVLTE
ncbi:MAG: S1 family peptidase [Candidatus Limnocylindria bacterium]